MTKYPHLQNNESDFPYINDVDVYKYDNDFDYSRYDYDQMKITVCTVPWDMGEAHIGNRTISGIGNVVDFGSKAKRDKWFDDIPDSECFRYTTLYRQLHRENKISVDIPFDVASNYNYVAVEYMGLANDNSPVINENSSGRRRWFWFIREVEFVAPNSTILHLMADAWQTFIYDIEISNMILERGHAPIKSVNVSTYLANPIAHNSYLLADDVNFGGESVVRQANYVPIGNGRKYCLFAVPLTQAGLLATGGAASGNSTDPTYVDTNDRWGYQYQVNGYDWEFADGNYTSATLPVQSLLSSDNVYNGNAVFAVRSEDALAFFNVLAASYMHVINAIQGVFVVSEDMLSLGTAFTFHGYNVYPANKLNSTINLDLTKTMFGYGSNWADLTKLYTYPYAKLEFVDDEGNGGEIRIENTGSGLGVRKELSIAFPFVEYRAFPVGVNGNATSTYKWRNLANTADETITLYADDFSRFMQTFDIPTYALYVDSAASDSARDYSEMQSRRADALANYHNTVRSANTAFENAIDSYQTIKNNADRLADTEKSNADDMADAEKDNADNMADTIKGNVNRSANTLDANQVVQNNANVDITNESITRTLEINAESNDASDDITSYNNIKLAADLSEDNAMNYSLANANNDAIAATTAANNGTSVQLTDLGIVQNVVSGVGALIGGDTGGAASNFISAGTAVAGTQISTANATAVTSIQVGCNIDTRQIVTEGNRRKTNNALQCNRDTVARQILASSRNCTSSCNALSNNTITGNTAATTITGNTAQTQRDNATDTNTTTKNNALNTQTTVKNNALNTQTTVKTNALNTQTTDSFNAGYTQESEVLNAKNLLELRQLQESNRWKSRSLDVPKLATAYSGDAFPEVFKRRGVRFNVRTQPDYAIQAAGDEFLRYGYMLDKQWNFTGDWQVMKHFTYWKLRDFWIRGLNVPDMYVDKIRFFLYGGVTVWDKPESIGNVTIYENML